MPDSPIFNLSPAGGEESPWTVVHRLLQGLLEREQRLLGRVGALEADYQELRDLVEAGRAPPPPAPPAPAPDPPVVVHVDTAPRRIEFVRDPKTGQLLSATSTAIKETAT